MSSNHQSRVIASQVWWELKQDAPKSGAERLAPVRKTRRHRLHVLQSEPVRDSLVRFHGEQEILSGAVCPALQCLLRRESIEAVVDLHRREAGRVEGQEPSLEKVLGVEAPSPFLSTRIPRYRWRRDPNSSEVPPDPRPPLFRRLIEPNAPSCAGSGAARSMRGYGPQSSYRIPSPR